jgi:DNA mismatch repair protein MutH
MENFRDIGELEKFYEQFENTRLESLFEYINTNYPQIAISTNKGVVGQVLEALIGNAPNSDPNPDVGNLGIELKVLPIRKVGGRIQPKERSKIKSINYNTLIDEVWMSASVKKKIQKILFLIYEQPTDKTYRDWPELYFKGTLLFELNDKNEATIKKDWQGIQKKVKYELAQTLSEGDSKILGASTSGKGKLITYGNGSQAKQRSFSLKHTYLKVFYNEQKNNIKYQSLDLQRDVQLEDFIISRLNEALSEKNLSNVVALYDVPFSPASKSGFRLLLDKVLKVKDGRQVLELDEQDIVIKTVPVNRNYKPWESMSFPKFSLLDLIDEEWEGDNECELRKTLSKGYIFVPIVKEKEKVDGKYKFKSWESWVIGKAVFWKADKNELNKIRKEWEKTKQVVLNDVWTKQVKHGNGYRQENNLPKLNQTDVIHVRPHARNARDIDRPYYEYSKIEISWQSFWLNAGFVGNILSK